MIKRLYIHITYKRGLNVKLFHIFIGQVTMTKIDLNKAIESSYLKLQKATTEPLRNYDDAVKFGTTVQNEINTLTTVLNELRTDLFNYKKLWTWDNDQAAKMQTDIANLNIAVNALKGVIAWLAGATIHKTLQSFEALAYPREHVLTVLNKDFLKLVSVDFLLNAIHKEQPTIKNGSDLLKYWIPFLNNPTNSDQVFLAIFGYQSDGNTDSKLLMRQIEILEKNEHTGLTRAERVEYETNGFTRNNITDFMATIQRMYLSESDATYKELLTDYYNQLSNDKQIRAHLELV